jgi:hypothetical protein
MDGHAVSEMDGLLALARGALAGAFGIAAVSKLRRPARLREAIDGLGLRRLHGVISALLPPAELLVGLALLWADSAWMGAIGALVLLVGFTIVTGVNLARGRAPDCGCFGQRHSTPVGIPTLVRNQALIAVAGLVAVRGPASSGPDVLAWLGGVAETRRAALVIVIPLVALLSLSLPHLLDRITSRVRSRYEPLGSGGAVLPPGGLEKTSPSGNGDARGWLGSPRIELTIGMATYDDFDGVYFTLQALRLYQDLQNTELVVVDNYGSPATKDLVERWVNGRYILARDAVGTAAPRNVVFSEAAGDAVLCCDSHVLFQSGVVSRLRSFYRGHPDSEDLLQGPLMYDDGHLIATHLEPVWRDQMWGIWAVDPRGLDPEGEPFDVPMQGLGAFSCRRPAWPGFNPHFRGFGGEEGYIHEKFRQAGARTLCLPWLRWMHRFARPGGIRFPLTVEDKLRNYLIGHAELGLDNAPLLEHFSRYLPKGSLQTVLNDALGQSTPAR